ncbi:hypothetical protein FOA52_014494 [Chlamydomonas sp. UWO 241]|nr:hypothetical protein FOA52_014494 [Chlamydomonas sp. UWO 241]
MMLAKLLQDLDKCAEAEAIMRHVVRERERMHGGKHRETIVARVMLGQLLLEQERHTEAAPLLTGWQKLVGNWVDAG